jgi:hypothetical protein
MPPTLACYRAGGLPTDWQFDPDRRTEDRKTPFAAFRDHS